MTTPSPSQAEIDKVIKETGMDFIQARNHLISRYILQDRAPEFQSERWAKIRADGNRNCQLTTLPK